MDISIETGSAATEGRKVGAVLVVGAGIGGIQAALDLANSGFKVYLMDKNPSIGAEMARLDKTFPTNDCAMCILAPKMVDIARHPDIELITNADLESADGNAGDFTVALKKRARYVDAQRCTGCGVCSTKCPVVIPDEYNAGLSDTRCIHVPFPQAVPLLAIIDAAHCLYLTRDRCGVCEKVCEAKAVDFDQQDEEIEIAVGSIILAPGFAPFDATEKAEYGYGRYPNVITGVEYERISSASGPTNGKIVRPSDGAVPRSVAFVQCVGTRDERMGRDYCSSVCCMYATKQMIMGKEHLPDTEFCMFYMDVRTFGKGSEAYYNDAKEKGAKYVNHRVSGLEETPDHDLVIRYEDESGTLKEGRFDLVVLSVGLLPPRGAEELAAKLGIELNRYNFCATDLFTPVQTSREGIYVCGAFSEPKDIPDTISQACGAAALSASLLASERGRLVKPKENGRPLRTTAGKAPRIGAFVCHCGINIAGTVDVDAVRDYAGGLPNVVYAEDVLYTCSQDAQVRIKELIDEYALNRVVVAACTPRTHESLFQDTIGEAGLNPYLFQMANIRDQCSWTHMGEPEKATEKAKDLVRMAVARAALLEPLQRIPQEVTPVAAVIGGGLSGMTAALRLADSGIDVHLVEREKELGGQMRRIHFLLRQENPQGYLHDLIDRVSRHPKITVSTSAQVDEVHGYVGNFDLTVGRNGSPENLKAGAIVVATGARRYEPTGEYLYGTDDRIITQLDLEERLHSGTMDAKDIVMIQCVGSRDEERPYCSRICCSEAIKNALKIKEISPESNVYVLYRDVRTYGFREEYYRKARRAGVNFLRYELENGPQITREDSQLRLAFFDSILNRTLVFHPDLVVLSVGIVPEKGNGKLGEMLKVPLNKDRFFLEAHVKLRPLDFAANGIFLCGLAHSPKFIDENISQAYGAAMRAMTVLSQEFVEGEGIVAHSEEDMCRGCERCKDVCAFNAIEMVENEEGARVARINAVVCKGCGRCGVVCPSGAITTLHFTNDQVGAMVEAALMS